MHMKIPGPPRSLCNQNRHGPWNEASICSLVHRPPRPAFVACSTKSRPVAGGRPGRFRHVIRAAADVTDSVTVFNLLSPVPETLQRPDKLQMRGRSCLYNILQFETTLLRDGRNTTVITWKCFILFILSHCSGKYNMHLQLITTSKVRLLAWISSVWLSSGH